MKSQSRTRKLSLSKESLRRLGEAELRRAAGGTDEPLPYTVPHTECVLRDCRRPSEILAE